jgi:two-component system CheB/CheR fusion protein
VSVTFVDVTATVREKARLQAVIDGLPQHVAVLDRTGKIALVNQAWQRFAEANGAGGAEGIGIGADYLAVCVRSVGTDADQALAAARGLRDLLDGRSQKFELVYPCHSPTEERWFLLHAAPLPWALGGIVVSHVDVTAGKQAQLELAQLKEG